MPPPRLRPPAPVPQPVFAATVVLLLGLGMTALTLRGETPVALARFAAIGSGLGLLLALAIEFGHAWTNLLRADLVGLVALYFLLFFEFLFPQTRFDELFSSAEEVRQGIIACLWAFGAVAIGRHLVAGKSVRHWRIASFDAPRGTMIWMFWGCFFLGFLHMLIAVNFDPFELVQNFLAPRFDQPWGRGQLGDWRAMLTETGNLLYLVPPLAGVILARRKHYSKTQEFLVSLGVLFTFFYGFSTGTRNIIGSYLITFLVSFFYASGAKLTRSVVVSCALAAGLFLAAAFYGIEFRNVGLGNYLKGARESGEEARTLHVDYNIFVVSRLTSIFPEQRPFIGMDAPLWLLARPIPRVLWPGKPDGTAVSLEGALGEEGLTLSSTFVGEAYMAWGTAGVIIAGLAFGWLARWWTCKAYSLTSDFGILIYGSGFFSVVISMRSAYWLPVAILPTLTVCLVGVWLQSRTTGVRSMGRRAKGEEPRAKAEGLRDAKTEAVRGKREAASAKSEERSKWQRTTGPQTTGPVVTPSPLSAPGRGPSALCP